MTKLRLPIDGDLDFRLLVKVFGCEIETNLGVKVRRHSLQKELAPLKAKQSSTQKMNRSSRQ